MHHAVLLFKYICLLCLFQQLFHLTNANKNNNPAIIVLGYDRSSQLRHTIRSIVQAIPNHIQIPIFLSVDQNPKAYRVIRTAQITPNITEIWTTPPTPYSLSPRARISRHYHFVLTRIFNTTYTNNTQFTHAILFEDDLRLSPDSITFLLASLPYLSPATNNPVCASLWNDNAYNPNSKHDNIQLTTFFPGLGWVLPKSAFQNLSSIWPIPPATIAPTGWDFWLRIIFDQYKWSCIIPQLPRVKHMSVTGVNVASNQQSDQFLNANFANTSINQIDWSKKVQQVSNLKQYKKSIQYRLLHSPVVNSLQQAIQKAHQKPVFGYYREQFNEFAKELGLWPEPRSHFLHTLQVPLKNDDVLLYDIRRAGKYFKLPFVPQNISLSSITFVTGERNVSCDQICMARKLRCEASALEFANTCESLQKMLGPCRACAYETGTDLPAKVVDNATIHTAGLCLITETGLGPGGLLDCKGQFEWTIRNCACVGKGDNSHVNITNYSNHDEL